jgi:hypothetical protein
MVVVVVGTGTAFLSAVDPAAAIPPLHSSPPCFCNRRLDVTQISAGKNGRVKACCAWAYRPTPNSRTINLFESRDLGNGAARSDLFLVCDLSSFKVGIVCAVKSAYFTSLRSKKLMKGVIFL